MQVDTESQLRSELDSSFIQSDSEFSEDLLKPTRQISGFSKFKKDNKRTADISCDDSVSDSDDEKQEIKVKIEEVEKPVFTDKPVQPAKPQKKRRRRRDVVFKRILRECRRFFQTKLNELTGFIASKKPRKDDYIYR